MFGFCVGAFYAATMRTDVELLRDYAENNSEAAFGELVQRQVKLVYSIALRQCGGRASNGCTGA